MSLFPISKRLTFFGLFRICSFQGPDEGLGACLHIQVGVAPLKVLTHRNGIVPKNCPSISRDIFGGTFIGGLEIFF